MERIQRDDGCVPSWGRRRDLSPSAFPSPSPAYPSAFLSCPAAGVVCALRLGTQLQPRPRYDDDDDDDGPPVGKCCGMMYCCATNFPPPIGCSVFFPRVHVPGRHMVHLLVRFWRRRNSFNRSRASPLQQDRLHTFCDVLAWTFPFVGIVYFPSTLNDFFFHSDACRHRQRQHPKRNRIRSGVGRAHRIFRPLLQ